MSAPRLWFPLDALFTEQEVVKILQTETATAGPWLFVWLLCEAYKRHFLKERPSGHVNMSYARLVQDAGVEPRAFESADEVARRAMRNLRDAGIVEFVEGDLESATFRVRFSKWADWLPSAFADPTNAGRQAKHRAENPGGGTPRNGDERYVTESNAKRESKRTTATAQLRPEITRLSNLLAELIRTRDGKARVSPDARPWLDAIRLLIDTDGRTPAEVEHVIRWCQADAFWRVNILSAPKLRQKFDQLIAKAGKPKGTPDDFFKRNGM